jgi:hypothetical protein
MPHLKISCYNAKDQEVKTPNVKMHGQLTVLHLVLKRKKGD